MRKNKSDPYPVVAPLFTQKAKVVVCVKNLKRELENEVSSHRWTE